MLRLYYDEVDDSLDYNTCARVPSVNQNIRAPPKPTPVPESSVRAAQMDDTAAYLT